MNEKQLNQYQSLQREIARYEEDLAELEEEAYKAVKQDGMPHVPGISDTVGNLATRIASLKAEIEDMLEDRLLARHNIEYYINSIQDSETRLAFKLRFICGKGYKDIAEELDRSISYIFYKITDYIKRK